MLNGSRMSGMFHISYIVNNNCLVYYHIPSTGKGSGGFKGGERRTVPTGGGWAVS